jgi:DNA-binding TFAR19-related protein (PDSD5 family)
MSDDQQQQQQQQQFEQEQAQRQQILTQIMTSDAFTRLRTVSLVKPSVAARVEQTLLMRAQRRQITQRIDDAALIRMLAEASDDSQRPTITVARKTMAQDNEDDDDDDEAGWGE